MTLVNLGWSQYAQAIYMNMRDRLLPREVAEIGGTWQVRVASMQDKHIWNYKTLNLIKIKIKWIQCFAKRKTFDSVVLWYFNHPFVLPLASRLLWRLEVYYFSNNLLDIRSGRWHWGSIIFLENGHHLKAFNSLKIFRKLSLYDIISQLVLTDFFIKDL